MTKRARLVALLEQAGPTGMPAADLALHLGQKYATVKQVVHQLNAHPAWPAIVGSGPGQGKKGRYWLERHAPWNPGDYSAAVSP